MSESRHLRGEQVRNFLDAIDFAARIGRPLGVHVTINYGQTPCPPDQVGEKFRRMVRRRLTPWLSYLARRQPSAGQPTYAWVVENQGGLTHVHWLLHLPSNLEVSFQKKVRIWVKELVGDQGQDPVDIQLKLPKVRSLGRYLMKGLEPRLAKKFQIRAEAQGRVTGKRSGTSENIGPKARERAAIEAGLRKTGTVERVA